MTGKPDDISRLDPTKRIGDEQKMGTPNQSFEQYMQKSGGNPMGKTPEISPFDLANRQMSLAAGPTFDSLLTQVKSAQSLLGDVNTHLNTPNLKLKQSSRYLLRNKLTDANAHLRAANSKLGVEAPAMPPSTGGGVLGKFLDLVNEGNSNLMAAQQQLTSLKAKGENLKPGDFLIMQLKLATAQQEIEYSSLMLGKAVQDITTMMNIQL